MLKQELLTEDQNLFIDRLYNYDSTLAVAAMGAGKSVATLTAISELLAEGVIKKVLIIAPLKVCKTVWKQEAAKWEHTAHLDIALCIGTPAQRHKAIQQNAQITVINFENIPWLFDSFKGLFDALVVDEITKLKTAGGKQFKKLRPQLKFFNWRVGLTGTPVSEDWLSLYAMCLIMDSGKALGTSQEGFKRFYFFATDYQEYDWQLHDWAAEAISKKIKGLVYNMGDYRHELPDIHYRQKQLVMPVDVRAQYKELFANSVVELNGQIVAAETAAVLSGKLQQVCNGFAYISDEQAGTRDTVLVSDYRVQALAQAVADTDGNVIVAYWYQADRERILQALPQAQELKGDIEQVAADWNAGKIPVLLLHPRSAGHGLNLAKGGHNIIWYSQVWSRDLWEQTNARLWRRGQTKGVNVVSLVVLDSIDESMQARVEGKAEYEALWLQHLDSGGAGV